MIDQFKARVRGDTGRLAATYLAIIMSLTIVFSSVIYTISSSQFNRQLPTDAYSSLNDDYQIYSNSSSLRHWFELRAEEAREELLLSLLLLNVVVLVGGGFFSYFLARKTLAPIEAAIEAQSRFVSDASHELRTPLTALQVTNEVALRKKKLTIADAKELIQHNLTETIKLRSLSEALLGLAKQDRADTSVKKLALRPVIEGVVKELSPLAHDGLVTIRQSVSNVSLAGNQAAIEQILRILLDNAIKYSPHGSTVTVGARRTKTGTIVSVTDHGPGIAADQHIKIFDRFYRVDESRSSQNVSGNGLGLAIAHSIALRQGYELSVESEIGQGATFSVLIR